MEVPAEKVGKITKMSSLHTKAQGEPTHRAISKLPYRSGSPQTKAAHNAQTFYPTHVHWQITVARLARYNSGATLLA